MTNALHNQLIEIPGRTEGQILRGKVAELFGPQMAFSFHGTLHPYRVATLQLNGRKEPVAVVMEGDWKVGDEVAAVYRCGIKAAALSCAAELVVHFGEDKTVMSLAPVRARGDKDKASALRAAMGASRLPQGLSFAPPMACDILPKPSFG